jgi:uncharacterized protein
MLLLPEDHPTAVAVTAAIRGGRLEALERLLAESPELATARIVDARGVGRSLLHLATDWPGHFPAVARTIATLAAAGADVNAVVQHPVRHESRETPLHWAASSNDVEALEALLDHGAVLEAPGAVFTGGPAMSDAVVFAQWEAARHLLARGARTTLWQAAALGLVDRVAAECAGDSPPDAPQVTNAFWHACRGGQRAVAEYLLARGADHTWVGHDDKRPIDVAREGGANELAAWLASLEGMSSGSARG